VTRRSPHRREITQRELRNRSGEIMRALDRGETFLVTRNGVPVGELTPRRHGPFVPVATVVGVFAGSARIDPARFRSDLDRHLDQDPAPRG
jgi:prevent-host-death family protein